MAARRVVVAMSGGVDSSVAAVLLKEAGYEVIGVSMKLVTEENGYLSSYHRRCCSIEEMERARRVCQILDIPHYVLNLERQFQTHVINYFCEEYSQGRTPNPCLVCNQKIKFSFLLNKALAMGANYLATGHYARVRRDNGKYQLLKGVDPLKDQSYLLYTLGQRELANLLFPLGGYRKAEVRSIAAARGLPQAYQPDSQELCFIPDGNYRRFLAQRILAQPGAIVDTEGRVLGQHPGLAFYTVGQRQGLGLSDKRRLYVVRIDHSRNQLVVGPGEQLTRQTIVATKMSFVSGEEPSEPIPVAARIRYRSLEASAAVIPEEHQAQVKFEVAQRAVAPGQAVVFYQGDVVLGGGIISSSGTSPGP